MTSELSAKQLKYLRGLGHALSPVVTVGQRGLSPAVLAEIDAALTHHELIKVKLRGERNERAVWIETITAGANAALVNKIGQIACFYRPNPDQPKIQLPPRRPAAT